MVWVTTGSTLCVILPTRRLGARAIDSRQGIAWRLSSHKDTCQLDHSEPTVCAECSFFSCQCFVYANSDAQLEQAKHRFRCTPTVLMCW
jgi:hypothetical protein